MTIRILLVEDHRITLEGLQALLAQERGMEVVGSATNGRDAERLALELRPDLVIVDIGLPEMNGIDATRRILAVHPSAKVIALSMHSDRRFVDGMLAAGACGYILKESAFRELAAAIHAVLAGRVYFSPAVADVVAMEYVSYVRTVAASSNPRLTPREREVLQLVAEGLSNREIAHRLCVSMKTVETHRAQIMNKLNLRSVAELTKYAIREGLTELET